MSPTLSQLDTLIHMTNWVADQREVLVLARGHIVALETELYHYCGDHPDPMDEGKARSLPGFKWAAIWHGRTIASRKLLGLPGYGPDPALAALAHPYAELAPVNEDMLAPIDRGFGRPLAELEKVIAESA